MGDVQGNVSQYRTFIGKDAVFDTVTANQVITPGGGSITGVTATSPLVATGGAVRNVAIGSAVPVSLGGTASTSFTGNRVIASNGPGNALVATTIDPSTLTGLMQTDMSNAAATLNLPGPTTLNVPTDLTVQTAAAGSLTWSSPFTSSQALFEAGGGSPLGSAQVKLQVDNGIALVEVKGGTTLGVVNVLGEAGVSASSLNGTLSLNQGGPAGSFLELTGGGIFGTTPAGQDILVSAGQNFEASAAGDLVVIAGGALGMQGSGVGLTSTDEMNITASNLLELHSNSGALQMTGNNQVSLSTTGPESSVLLDATGFTQTTTGQVQMHGDSAVTLDTGDDIFLQASVSQHHTCNAGLYEVTTAANGSSVKFDVAPTGGGGDGAYFLAKVHNGLSQLSLTDNSASLTSDSSVNIASNAADVEILPFANCRIQTGDGSNGHILIQTGVGDGASNYITMQTDPGGSGGPITIVADNASVNVSALTQYLNVTGAGTATLGSTNCRVVCNDPFTGTQNGIDVLGGDSTDGQPAGNVQVTAGAYSGGSDLDGGAIGLQAGDAQVGTGNGGGVSIFGGAAGDGTGGAIVVTAGAAESGGPITITGGAGGAGGGDVNIYSGDCSNGNAGNVLVSGGSATGTGVAGGAVLLQGGSASGSGAYAGNVRVMGFPLWQEVGADIASATTITPTSYCHRVTGTTTVATITVPYPGFQGTICLITTGILTFTGGNIASTRISTVDKAFYFTYLPATAKWYTT